MRRTGRIVDGTDSTAPKKWFLTPDVRVTPALVGLDEAGRARVATSGAAQLPETLRFLLARALFLSPDATSRKPPRLLTRSNSWAQRASRAFPAELLVPADELC